MSDNQFFELGPDKTRGVVFAGRDKVPYVKLARSSLRNQIGGDLLITKQCDSFEEFRDQILLLKSELDQVLIEAKERYTQGI